MLQLLLIFFALLPGALLAGFFITHFRRRLSSELAALALGLGVISAFLVIAIVAVPQAFLLSNHMPSLPASISALCEAFFGAGLPEESVKFLFLMAVIRRHEDCDSGGDIFCSAILVGLGFAAVENILYVTENSSNWLNVGLLRAVLAVPGHAIYAMMMGHFVAQAFRLSGTGTSRHLGLFIAALAVPIIFHTLYDYPLMLIDAQGQSGDSHIDRLTHTLLGVQVAVQILAALIAWVFARQELVTIYRRRLDRDLAMPSSRALLPWRVLGGLMILGALGCAGIAIWLMTRHEDASTILLLVSVFPLVFGLIMHLRPPKSLPAALLGNQAQ